MKRIAVILAVVLTLAMGQPLAAHFVPEENKITTPPSSAGDYTYVVKWWGSIFTLEEQLRKNGNGIFSRQWEFNAWESSDSVSVFYTMFIRWAAGHPGDSIEILVPRHAVPFTGQTTVMHGLAKRIICWYRPWDFPTRCPISAP